MTDMIVAIPPDEHDLSDFKRVNEQEKASGKKLAWDERLRMIRQHFPSTASLDWYEAFRQDPTLLGKIYNDILKADQAEPGRPGKRPSLDTKTAEDRLRQITGEDYTVLPFQQAFKILAGDRSIRHLANKTGLNRNTVHDLLTGKIEPRAETMEAVARGFNKKPSYFAEYRTMYVIATLLYRLESQPEASVVFYRKLRGQAEKGWK